MALCLYCPCLSMTPVTLPVPTCHSALMHIRHPCHRLGGSSGTWVAHCSLPCFILPPRADGTACRLPPPAFLLCLSCNMQLLICKPVPPVSFTVSLFPTAAVACTLSCTVPFMLPHLYLHATCTHTAAMHTTHTPWLTLPAAALQHLSHSCHLSLAAPYFHPTFFSVDGAANHLKLSSVAPVAGPSCCHFMRLCNGHFLLAAKLSLAPPASYLPRMSTVNGGA